MEKNLTVNIKDLTEVALSLWLLFCTKASNLKFIHTKMFNLF